MSEPVKLRIMTSAKGEPAGYDSSIISVPGRWYVTLNGRQTLLARQAGRELRQLSEQHAADLGEILHHAEWTITSDREQVRTLGLMHDCAACRADTDQALTFLRENPDGEVAVGQLWWAEQ